MHSAFVAALGSYSQHTRSCITPSTRHCKPRCLRDRPQPHQQYMSRPASWRTLALRPLHRRATLGGALVSLALVRRKAHLLRQLRLRQHPMYRRCRSWCRPFHSLKRPFHRSRTSDSRSSASSASAGRRARSSPTSITSQKAEMSHHCPVRCALWPCRVETLAPASSRSPGCSAETLWSRTTLAEPLQPWGKAASPRSSGC